MERDNRRRRTSLWVYAIRTEGGPSIDAQRARLYEWAHVRQAVHLEMRRITDWHLRSAEGHSCLSCKLFVRLERNDQVCMCAESFAGLCPLARVALVQSVRASYGQLWLVGDDGQASLARLPHDHPRLRYRAADLPEDPARHG